MAENGALGAETGDIPDDEEVAGQLEPVDDAQLVSKLADMRLRHLRVAPPRPGPGQFLQVALLGVPRRNREIGQRGFELLEREPAALGDREGVGRRLGVAGEPARHHRRRLEAPLRIRVEQLAGLVERGVVADTGKHVLQPAAVGGGVVDIVGGDRGKAEPPSQPHQRGAEVLVHRQVVMAKLDIHVVAPVQVAVVGEQPFRLRVLLPQETRREVIVDERDETVGVPLQQSARHPCLPLGALQLGGGEQLGEVGVAGAVFDQQHQPVPGVQKRGRPENRTEPRPARLLVKTDNTVQTVGVGDRQRGIAEFDRPVDQRLRVAGAVEERKVRVAVEFDVGNGGHGSSRSGPLWS